MINPTCICSILWFIQSSSCGQSYLYLQHSLDLFSLAPVVSPTCISSIGWFIQSIPWSARPVFVAFSDLFSLSPVVSPTCISNILWFIQSCSWGQYYLYLQHSLIIQSSSCGHSYLYLQHSLIYSVLPLWAVLPLYVTVAFSDLFSLAPVGSPTFICSILWFIQSSSCGQSYLYLQHSLIYSVLPLWSVLPVFVAFSDLFSLAPVGSPTFICSILWFIQCCPCGQSYLYLHHSLIYSILPLWSLLPVYPAFSDLFSLAHVVSPTCICSSLWFIQSSPCGQSYLYFQHSLIYLVYPLWSAWPVSVAFSDLFSLSPVVSPTCICSILWFIQSSSCGQSYLYLQHSDLFNLGPVVSPTCICSILWFIQSSSCGQSYLHLQHSLIYLA